MLAFDYNKNDKSNKILELNQITLSYKKGKLSKKVAFLNNIKDGA